MCSDGHLRRKARTKKDRKGTERKRKERTIRSGVSCLRMRESTMNERKEKDIKGKEGTIIV